MSTNSFDYDEGQLYIPTFFPGVADLPGKLSVWRSGLILAAVLSFLLPLPLHLCGGGGGNDGVQFSKVCSPPAPASSWPLCPASCCPCRCTFAAAAAAMCSSTRCASHLPFHPQTCLCFLFDAMSLMPWF